MDSDSGALAIIGKAGCGKSVLAKTIQEGVPHHWNRLSQSSSNHDLLLVRSSFNSAAEVSTWALTLAPLLSNI